VLDTGIQNSLKDGLPNAQPYDKLISKVKRSDSLELVGTQRVLLSLDSSRDTTAIKKNFLPNATQDDSPKLGELCAQWIKTAEAYRY